MPLTPAAQVWAPLWERLVEIYFSSFNLGDCVSLMACMTTEWQCCLTDIEWGVKEPQRTTSSLAVTMHHRCPTCIRIYAANTWRALWSCGYGPRLWIKRCRVRVSVAVVWCCVLGQGTSLVCGVFWSLSTQKWKGSWLDSDCLYDLWLNSFRHHDGSIAVCSAGSWVDPATNLFHNQGKSAKTHWNWKWWSLCKMTTNDNSTNNHENSCMGSS